MASSVLPGSGLHAVTAHDGKPEDNLREKATRIRGAEVLTSAINAFCTAITPSQADTVTTWVGYELPQWICRRGGSVM